ncbi:MAG TPA: lysophospholipase [Candidatus Saccharimonadia bacterium]|nr:lysophospholipase [Candidatus Saccharimonadia bacterium]
MTEAPTDQPTTHDPASTAVAAAPETQGSFLGMGGLELFARRWAPSGQPRAAIAIVHGFGDHSGRYADAVEPLTAAGFAVHGFDLRGHGRSSGRRGHIDAWSDYRDDIDLYLDHVRSQETEGTPLVLYGHSLGAVIVLESVLRRHERSVAVEDGLVGVIASSPALRPDGVRSPVRESLAAGISPVWPTIAMNVPLENEALSRSPERVAGAKADPLNHRRLTARGTVETFRALAWIDAHAGEWRLPLFIFHGSADRICNPAGTVAFAENARAGGAPDVELQIYEGGYHEAHNDIDAAVVEADVVDWLDRHLAAPTRT